MQSYDAPISSEVSEAAKKLATAFEGDIYPDRHEEWALADPFYLRV